MIWVIVKFAVPVPDVSNLHANGILGKIIWSIVLSPTVAGALDILLASRIDVPDLYPNKLHPILVSVVADDDVKILAKPFWLGISLVRLVGALTLS